MSPRGQIKDLKNIKTLDFYVLRAIEHLEGLRLPEIKIEINDKNIFLGSGSAACLAELFTKRFGGFSRNVNNYKRFFKKADNKNIGSTYIISASGGKDAVKMADFLVKAGLETTLITCNEEAPAKKLSEKTIVFPALQEPPTYNVSTYSSMIYWLFGENINKIKKILRQLKIPNLRKYKYIFFLAADEYDVIAKMASRKVAETLEGIGSNGDGFSNSAHGMLRQPNKQRLVFCLNQSWPEKEDVYSISIDSHLGLMLASYYVIGKNQTKKDTKNLLKDYEKTIKRLGWKINKIF